jgi:WD40 repeat protein/tRNA A-37 threonylcarbamoyl transferase component Bud32/tetratricopeptide (TPR) repeat protein
MNSIDCPTLQQLSAYHLGNLPDAAQDSVTEHLEACAACEAALQRLESESDHVLAALRGSAAAEDEALTEVKTPARPSVRPAASFLTAEVCPPGYELLSVLGEGGMGIVYKARHRTLNRFVALKMLQRQTPAALARFRTEAEAVARLQHPQIIQIFEVGEHQGRAFLVLEYVAGGSLAQRIAQAPPPVRASAALVRTLALAVLCAHRSGVIHRDLKPANVLLTADGAAKISDFGLAKQLDGEALHTQSGDLLGTPSYMAPEQAGGRWREVGPAVDVYALGAILYELLTGRPPFKAKTPLDTLMLVMNADAPSVSQLQPHVPRDLSTITMKCLEKAPERRYASAQALADDLGRFLDGRPIQARAVSRLEHLRRWAARNPIVAGLTAGLFLVLVAGIAGVSWKWQEAEKRGLETEAERNNVVAAQRETIKERNDAQELSASLRLDKGIELAERGDVGAGLHWMLEAVRTAPAGAADLRRVARLNLTAWLGQTPALQHMIPLPPDTRALTLHPDGKRVLAGYGSGGKTSCLAWFDVATAKSVKAWDLPAPTGGLAIRPDGQRLLTAYYPHPYAAEAQSWELDSGAMLAGPFQGWYAWPVFRPDGAAFATAEKGHIRVREVDSGKIIGEHPLAPKTEISGVAFSPDGRRVAFALGGLNWLSPTSARLWDVGRSQLVGEPMPHNRSVQSLAFSPDGRWLATGSLDHTAQRWDAQSGKPVGIPLMHPYAVESVGFSPDGRTLVTRDYQNSLSSWEAATGQRVVAALPRASSLTPEFTADGKYVLTGADFGRMTFNVRLATDAEIWQVARGSYGALPQGDILHRTISERPPLETVVFSPDGATVFMGSDARWVRLLDVATGQPRGRLRRHPWPIRAVAFSPDGKRVAVTSHDGGDEFNGSPLSLCEVLDSQSGQPVCPPLPHSHWVEQLVFTPDSKTLLTGGFDNCVHFWDVATGRESRAPLHHPGAVLHFALSPNGRSLAVRHAAAGAAPAHVVLWSLSDFTRIRPPLPEAKAFHFSPDSKTLLTGMPGEHTYRFWDAGTGAPKGAIQAEVGREFHARFSPDSGALLTGSVSGTVRIWETASGKPLGKPMLYPAGVQAAAFSPDAAGQYLLIGYRDGCFRLWDRRAGRTVGPTMWHRSGIAECAFTPDGRSALTVSDEGEVYVWPVPALPAEGEDFERLRLRLEVRTGSVLRNGETVERLRPDEWRARKNRLIELEGSAESASTGFVSDLAWHDREARDAKRDGAPFAELWHLDRAIALAANNDPQLAMFFARRAHFHAMADRFSQADDDYAQARKRTSPEQVRDFRQHAEAAAQMAGRGSVARWYQDQAQIEAPTDWYPYAARAFLDELQNRQPERQAELAKAIAHGADTYFLLRLAKQEVDKGQWDKAAEYYHLAAKAGPLPPAAWEHVALVHLRRGDQAAYRRLCEDLPALAKASPSLTIANAAASVFALGPGESEDLASAVAVAESAVTRTDRTRPAYLSTLGAVLYRAGRYRDAIETLHEKMKTSQEAGDLQDCVFLAMACHRAGDTDAAKAWMARVQAAAPPAGDLKQWPNLKGELLRREAERLLARSSKGK